MSDVYDSNKISKYNEGVNQVTRLDELWRDCNKLSCAGRLSAWRWKLDNVWRELCADVDRVDKKIKDDKEKFSTKREKIIKEIKENKDVKKLYGFLDKLEMLLRKLQDKAGKAGVLIDEDADGM